MSDLSITAASVVPGSGATIVSNLVAGIAVTQGQVVFLDPTSNKWWLATAAASPLGGSNTIAQPTPSGSGVKLGIALNSASPGQLLTVLTAGSITIGATLVAGESYYLSITTGSTTGGDIIAAAGAGSAPDASGNYPCFLGMAISTTVLNFTPIAAGVAHG